MLILEMNQAAQTQHAEDGADGAFARSQDRAPQEGLGIRPDTDGEQRRKGLQRSHEIRTLIEQHPPVRPTPDDNYGRTLKRMDKAELRAFRFLVFLLKVSRHAGFAQHTLKPMLCENFYLPLWLA